ncbi:hypothetical protein VP01_2140g7 [Puccinia sorghi]|uniref:Uncharacterized protein n=1 Tax=Puccinia sorghi TaxID=27349 RepID=A0A0L6V9N7_9BASI|nr:hypothetical protein VP01_2140g7 [Puccinia sorghi]
MPADAPQVLADPADSLAVQLAIARANGVPRKRQHTAEQIQVSVALAATKRMNTCAEKAETLRIKAAAKAGKDMLKHAKLAAAASRFMWTETASLEILAFVKMIKDEHNELSLRQPGFTTLPKYFLQNNA